MQTRAILEAAAQRRQGGHQAPPEDHDPAGRPCQRAARGAPPAGGGGEGDRGRELGGKVDYKFGTMIELPRAALTAGQIAEVAEFFSFGTNDLTQTTFGMSRDDAEGKFLLQVRRGAGRARAGPAGQDPQDQPVPDARPRRRGPPDPASPSRRGARANPEAGGGHLRRARRRPRQHRLLPRDRPELRQLLAVPRAGGAAGGGAGRHRA